MAVEERDPVSGQKTTGHEWNGIKELDTPVPRGVLIFIIVTHVWALLWWILMPTLPMSTTYTKGVLEHRPAQDRRAGPDRAQAQRAAWVKAIETSSYEEILANEDLMKVVRTTGHQLFGDNCAACHGGRRTGPRQLSRPDGRGLALGRRPGEDRRDHAVGINSTHQNTRVAQMPAFGRDAILDRNQVTNVGDLRAVAVQSRGLHAAERRRSRPDGRSSSPPAPPATARTARATGRSALRT